MRNSRGRRTQSTKNGKSSRSKKRSKVRTYILLLYLLFLIIGTTTHFGVSGDGIIIIDPGHGGKDPGAMYYNVNEKDINLEVAKKTADILESSGYEVILTRDKDEFIELSERAAISNRKNGTVFVSLHCNASENSQSYGIETYNARQSQDGKELGKVIHKAVLNSTGAEDRGTYEKNFLVLRETKCPAILVEMGFMSNEAELNNLTDAGYQKKIAKGIADGIRDYIE